MRSWAASPEWSAAAAMPRARSASTWSFMSAMSGDTTTVVPVEEQRGQLEAERLAGAGGHDGHQVSALEHGERGLPLSGPKGLQAEAIVEGLARASGRGIRGWRGRHGWNLPGRRPGREAPNSTGGRWRPRPPVALLHLHDLPLGRHAVPVEDEEQVVARRRRVRRSTAPSRSRPSTLRVNASVLARWLGVERVGDRAEPDPAHLGHLRGVRRGHRERLRRSPRWSATAPVIVGRAPLNRYGGGRSRGWPGAGTGPALPGIVGVAAARRAAPSRRAGAATPSGSPDRSLLLGELRSSGRSSGPTAPPRAPRRRDRLNPPPLVPPVTSTWPSGRMVALRCRRG